MIVAEIVAERPSQPYPGLRPFEAYEWSIFFGRERMVDDVIDRLARDRLVVVHGASGSGKSSLIRAGVLPKLARQHLRHGAPWLTCAIRPSGGPLWNLATEFAKLEERADDLARVQAIHGLFSRRDATLASVVGASEQLSGKSVCVLVDQFEELFRYERETSREEAELFVDLIGSVAMEPDGARAQDSAEVHVVVTMRSEFLGACARFDGLAETINRTQYLVPRMDDNSLMRAVRRPARMFDGFIDERLSARLIASVRGREDELPLLQHGLMLMWDEALRVKSGEGVVLDGTSVEKAGGLAELLSRHADEVMALVAPDERRARLVEMIFRELTDPNAEGSAIRRPRALLDLAAAAGIATDELRPLINAFRAPGVSFLTPYASAPLTDETVVDVSHEALIRCWRRITSGQDGWLRREFDDGLAWRSLLAEARAFAKNPARVLSAGATEDRSKLFAERNEFWSQRYGGGRRIVGNLLEASRKAAARARRRRLAVATSLAALTIGAIGAAGFSVVELRKETVAEAVALEEKAKEADAGARAKDAAEKAEKAEAKAQEEKEKAEIAAAKAEKAEAVALAERTKAVSAAVAAKKAEDDALVQKTNALDAASKAEAEKTKAAQESEVSKMVFANVLAVAQLRVPGKTTEQQFFERAKKLAENGNGVAEDIVGLCYLNGLGTSREYLKAREWFERSAAAGVPRAMLDMGYLYHFGRGVPVDFSKALEWYERAAAAGEIVAANNIGALYYDGVGVTEDDTRAHQYYEQAALAGDGMAMDNIGKQYWSGRGVPRDYTKAREWFEKGIAAGEPSAMRDIGSLYRDGAGVAKDYAKALEFFQMATDAGDVAAATEIGNLYYNGNAVSQDHVKAREYYEIAAEAGDRAAMRNLGVVYYNGGYGVTQDFNKAREWYEKAAGAGEATAMLDLANLYENGKGVSQDNGKAREWYEKAAQTGNANAMNRLAARYELGIGMPQDYAKAREWYEKAAATGDTDAMRSIASVYEDGRGVAQDYDKAREWYEKAAAAGDSSASREIFDLHIKVEKTEVHEVSAAGRYDDALRLQVDLAQEIEVDEVKTDNKPGERTARALQELSWYALFAHDFARALAASERAHLLAPDDLEIETNHAHALMFLGRTPESRKLYLQHRNDTISRNDKRWNQVIAEDFAEFRKAGLASPLMGEIESALATKSRGTNSR